MTLLLTKIRQEHDPKGKTRDIHGNMLMPCDNC